jgi:hypothetical protein
MKNIFNVGVFSLVGDRHFWRFILGHWVVCGQLFIPNIWQFNIVLVSYIFYALQVVECHVISERRGFEFMS